MNRKKNVTGTASEDSMKTEGPGLGTGPVGDQDGYQERKEQQANNGAPGRMTNRPGQTPLNRPKQVTGQATGSMNTQGTGAGSAPQQARPQNPGAQQSRPNPFLNQQQARPQQTNPFMNQQRPQQNQQRPQQQIPKQQARP